MRLHAAMRKLFKYQRRQHHAATDQQSRTALRTMPIYCQRMPTGKAAGGCLGGIAVGDIL